MSSNPFHVLGGSGASRPQPPPANRGQGPSADQPQSPRTPKKRKGHRGGRKKRQRRKSFAAMDDDDGHTSDSGRPQASGFYQMPASNISGTSVDSEALLDHRYAAGESQCMVDKC